MPGKSAQGNPPREIRIDASGGLHHIIARGIARRKVFDDNTDCEGPIVFQQA
jgi:hypothetical protein